MNPWHVSPALQRPDRPSVTGRGSQIMTTSIKFERWARLHNFLRCRATTIGWVGKQNGSGDRRGGGREVAPSSGPFRRVQVATLQLGRTRLLTRRGGHAEPSCHHRRACVGEHKQHEISGSLRGADAPLAPELGPLLTPCPLLRGPSHLQEKPRDSRKTP